MAQLDPRHRRSPLDERCIRHQFEAAIDRCRTCGNAFCGECLVYSFGEREPPFCVPCALSAAGVRSNAARTPSVSKKELRRRQKEARRIAAAAADTAQAEAEAPEIDWSLPVNGTDPNVDPNYPTFEDVPTQPRPQAPTPPPRDKGRSGLFGRKKNKVVPF
jgi:hypothetical protein